MAFVHYFSTFSSLEVIGLASSFDNLEFVLHLWLSKQSFFRYFCANYCVRKVTKAFMYFFMSLLAVVLCLFELKNQDL